MKCSSLYYSGVLRRRAATGQGDRTLYMSQSHSIMPIIGRGRPHIALCSRVEARRQREGQLPTWGGVATGSSAAGAPQSAKNRRSSNQAHRATVCWFAPLSFSYAPPKGIQRLMGRAKVRLCAQQPCAPHKPRRARCIPRPHQWPPSGS